MDPLGPDLAPWVGLAFALVVALWGSWAAGCQRREEEEEDPRGTTDT
jgi:hypothetical protein